MCGWDRDASAGNDECEGMKRVKCVRLERCDGGE